MAANHDSLEFHIFLQNEFLARVKRNSKYSVRAFAKQLKVNHSTLSQWMRGKRPVTPETVRRLAGPLGLTASQVQSFVRRLEAEHPDFGNYTQLSLDSFQIISEWYHYAIFEMLTLKNFRPEYSWIANMLGIKTSEARAAVERLTRVGLIEIKSPTEWVQKSPLVTTTGNKFTAAAFRNLQKGVLEKALWALNEVPFEVRDQSSVTMAIDTSKIPEAKIRIKKFRRDLCQFLQKSKNRDAVYQFGASFFPLTAISGGSL